MNDYIKHLESQNDELRRRLADQERMTDYWKNHPGHTYYINITYEDSIRIHSAPSVESAYHYLRMMLDDTTEVEELLISRYNGTTLYWTYSIHKSKAQTGVWCMNINKRLPNNVHRIQVVGGAASFDEALFATLNFVRDKYKIYDI